MLPRPFCDCSASSFIYLGRVHYAVFSNIVLLIKLFLFEELYYVQLYNLWQMKVMSNSDSNQNVRK